MDGTGSVFTNTNMQSHKKFYAFEDATNKNASVWVIMPLVIIYVLAFIANIYFPIRIKYMFSQKSQLFESTNDILTVLYEH